MKVLDLFAGIGGFSLAAHRMGWQTVAFVEWDKFCQKVLNKNFPGVPVYGDIREFDGTKYRGQVDIITGGFPCQPFSQAGKQKGKNDDRYLFPEMLRVIEEVNPRWIVAENVRGLLSIQNGEVFSEICSQLESKNYTVWTFGVPASAVEAPHERQRLWIVCTRGIEDSELSGPSSVRREILTGKPDETQAAGSTCSPDCDVADSDNTRGRTPWNETLENRSPDSIERANPFAESGGQHSDALNSERERSQGCTRSDATEQIGDGSNYGLLKPSDRDASDSDNRERQVHTGYGDDRALGESSVSNWKPSNPNSAGLQGHRKHGERTGERTSRQGSWEISWLEAATRLCRMDDGVSLELDFPRDNRVNRLKALGNSIVPQIAYEIFRSIEAAE